MLTRLQKTIIGAGATCLVLLACYLPWTYTVNTASGIHREKPAGYHFIFAPPRPEQESIAHGVKIDTPRVAIPMAVVVLATVAAVLLTGARRGHHERKWLTDERANDATRAAEERNRPHPTPSGAPVPSAGLPVGATGSVEAPATPEHDRRERDGNALFSTTIAVVVIWGACRAAFGSGFGGFCEGFVVILVGSVVGPWVARRLASNSSFATSADAAHNLSPDDAPSSPARPTRQTPSETDREEATRTEPPQSKTENASQQRSVVCSAGRATASATHFLLNGPPLSLILIAIAGSAIGVAVVLFTRGADSPSGNVPPATPPAQDKRTATDTSDDPFLALLSGKRGYDTPTVKLDYDVIIRRENEFIRLNPNDTHAYHIRGFAWLEKKEYEKAIGDFTQAIRSHPKNAKEGNCAFSSINRGTAWLEMGSPDEAIKDFDEALRLSLNYAYALSRRANAWNDKREYEKAIQDYDEAIRIDPECRFEDHINLAWLLATCPEDKFRDGARAIQLATRACELSDWKSGWALNSLAAAYAETGRFDEAMRYQKKALEDPAYRGSAGNEFRHRLWLYEHKKSYRGPVQHQHPTGRQAPFRG
jgi:Tfp pilus assembly protein PilF